MQNTKYKMADKPGYSGTFFKFKFKIFFFLINVYDVFLKLIGDLGFKNHTQQLN